MTDTIGFIGLGLIGGSIARAMKQKHPDLTLIAYEPDEESARLAHSDGTIDHIVSMDDPLFHACKYVFLCAKVEHNIANLEKLKDILPQDCILTDIGSTKGDIHEAVRRMELSRRFIGGHPMAGTEKSGYLYSNPLLLENAYYLLTIEEDAMRPKAEEFAQFIGSLGAIPMVLTYEQHDFATACISHLPHVIASTLVNVVSANDDENATLKKICAGGFKDITRIASSSPQMWEQICMANKDNISSLLDAYIGQLKRFQQSLADQDTAYLEQYFGHAKDYRDNISSDTRGLLPRCYDLNCDLKDEAGEIAMLATILASHQINIKNIGIVHNREFEEGVLHIEFYDAQSQKNASTILKRHSYQIYSR
jgi:prephenate dehydrogenase